MSSNHRRKIARALAAKTGLTYQQALAAVIDAAENGLLPHTLDKAGIQRAVDLLATSSPKPVRDLYAEMLDIPFGLVVVTGGVGAGKTAVLYDCIAELASREHVHVQTVESPIEHRIAATGPRSAIWQHSYGTDGMTFERVHRGALRCDPEVMMYSHIHDAEQARLVLDSALTGRLTLAEVHGYSAAEAIQRLLVHVEPLVLATSLRSIVVMEKDQGAFTREVTLIDDATRDYIETVEDSGSVSDAFMDGLVTRLAACPTQRTSHSTVEGAERPTFIAPTALLGLSTSVGPVGTSKSIDLPHLVEEASDIKVWTDLGYDASVAVAIQQAMSAQTGFVLFAGSQSSGHRVGLSTALEEQAGRGRSVALTQWMYETQLKIADPNIWQTHYGDELGDEPASAFGDVLKRNPDVASIGLVSEAVMQDAIAAAQSGQLIAARMIADDPLSALHHLHVRGDITPQAIADTVTCIVMHHKSGDTSRAYVVRLDDNLREVIAAYLGRIPQGIDALDASIEAATVIGSSFRTITDDEREAIRTGLRRLAAMLRVGMLPREACTSLAQTMAGEPKHVFQRLAAADTFGAGVAAETHVFDPWAITMIRNGEMGALDATLRELVEVF